MRRLSIAVFLALALAACKRPKPSPEFSEAQMAFESITTRDGDDAYSDPEMARIEGLLEKVPAASTDAAAAGALKAKIAREKERVAEDAKRRQADLDVLRAPVPTVSPRAPDPVPVKAAVDAGRPVDPLAESGQPQVGLSVELFLQRFGGCYSEGELITITNMNVRARSFSLAASEECQKKHAGIATRLVLIDGGKIIGLVPKESILQVAEAPPDAGKPPAPRAVTDAGR